MPLRWAQPSAPKHAGRSFGRHSLLLPPLLLSLLTLSVQRVAASRPQLELSRSAAAAGSANASGGGSALLAEAETEVSRGTVAAAESAGEHVAAHSSEGTAAAAAAQRASAAIASGANASSAARRGASFSDAARTARRAALKREIRAKGANRPRESANATFAAGAAGAANATGASNFAIGAAANRSAPAGSASSIGGSVGAGATSASAASRGRPRWMRSSLESNPILAARVAAALAKAQSSPVHTAVEDLGSGDPYLNHPSMWQAALSQQLSLGNDNASTDLGSNSSSNSSGAANLQTAISGLGAAVARAASSPEANALAYGMIAGYANQSDGQVGICGQDVVGSCLAFDCDRTKGPTVCTGMWKGGKCMCAPGFCSFNGKCVTPTEQDAEEKAAAAAAAPPPPAPAAAPAATPAAAGAGSGVKCRSEQVGSCLTLGCDASRGPTDCSGFWGGGKCTCKAGYCSYNGKCLTPAQQEEEEKAEKAAAAAAALAASKACPDEKVGTCPLGTVCDPDKGPTKCTGFPWYECRCDQDTCSKNNMCLTRDQLEAFAQPGGEAALTCERNTGGGCNTAECDASRGDTMCVGNLLAKRCMCKVGKCAKHGTCVEASQLDEETDAALTCDRNTGGSCTVSACDQSRGESECTGSLLSKSCTCKFGFCNKHGRCIEASKLDEETDAALKCDRNTGGGCMLGSCDASRGDQVQCEGIGPMATCTCKFGYCNRRGKCVEASQVDDDSDAGPVAAARKECTTDTGVQCDDNKNCDPDSGAHCLEDMCVCKPGYCAQVGKCVPVHELLYGNFTEFITAHGLPWAEAVAEGHAGVPEGTGMVVHGYRREKDVTPEMEEAWRQCKARMTEAKEFHDLLLWNITNFASGLSCDQIGFQINQTNRLVNMEKMKWLQMQADIDKYAAVAQEKQAIAKARKSPKSASDAEIATRKETKARQALKESQDLADKQMEAKNGLLGDKEQCDSLAGAKQAMADANEAWIVCKEEMDRAERRKRMGKKAYEQDKQLEKLLKEKNQDREDRLKEEAEKEEEIGDYPAIPMLASGYTPDEPIMRGPCFDTDGDILDVYGDSCQWYTANDGHRCGEFDTVEFHAKAMCCICGGGSTRNDYDEDAPVVLCEDSCKQGDKNSYCEDGGIRSISGVCKFGTDCFDCGPRLAANAAEELKKYNSMFPPISPTRANPLMDAGVQRSHCCKLAKQTALSVILAKNPVHSDLDDQDFVEYTKGMEKKRKKKEEELAKQAEEELARQQKEARERQKDEESASQLQLEAVRLIRPQRFNGTAAFPRQNGTWSRAPRTGAAADGEASEAALPAWQLQVATNIARAGRSRSGEADAEAKEDGAALAAASADTGAAAALRPQQPSVESASMLELRQLTRRANEARLRRSLRSERRLRRLRRALGGQFADLSSSDDLSRRRRRRKPPKVTNPAEGWETYTLKVTKMSSCDRMGFMVDKWSGRISHVRRSPTFLTGKWNMMNPGIQVRDGDYVQKVCMNGNCNAYPDIAGMIAKLSHRGKCKCRGGHMGVIGGSVPVTLEGFNF